MKYQLLFLISIIFVVSCSSNTVSESETVATKTPELPTSEVAPTPDEVEFAELIGTRWILQNIARQKLIPNTQITLQVSPKKFSGSAGCNCYYVEYNVNSANSFSVEFSAINLELCHEPEGVMEQEKQFLDLLNSSRSYQLQALTLSLLNEQRQPVLQFQRMPTFDVEPEALLGKSWQLISATDFEADDLTAFTLKFSDGTFSGKTICRDYQGEYQAIDDRLQFTFISMSTEYECDEPNGISEAEYTTLLENVEQYNLSATSLELYTRKGEKLVFELIKE